MRGEGMRACGKLQRGHRGNEDEEGGVGGGVRGTGAFLWAAGLKEDKINGELVVHIYVHHHNNKSHVKYY